MVSSKILMSENYDMNQRGDHSMHVGDPLVLTKNSKIEKLVLKKKKCLFSWKEIVSIRIGWFRARFWWVKIMTWTKGGTTVCMWGTLWSWQKIQKLKNLFLKKKKYLFSWKEIVSIRIGWFRARFWWVKIMTWTKGGTTVCMWGTLWSCKKFKN